MKAIEYKDKKGLVEALSLEIKSQLEAAIKSSKKATILVSGGSTPTPLFRSLSKFNISWDKVYIGLVDDRFVDQVDVKSNTRLIKENFLINFAKKAHFLPLVKDLGSKAHNLDSVIHDYKIFEDKTDVTILGMGNDGHTASLFPQDIASKIGLEPSFKESILYTTADIAPFERITCSASLLSKSEHIYLMITGQKKWEALRKAEKEFLPIAHFFIVEKTELIVYYTL